MNTTAYLSPSGASTTRSRPPGVDNGDGERARRTGARPLGKAAQNDALQGGAHVAYEAVQGRRRGPGRGPSKARLAEHLVENQAQRMETAANRNLTAGQLLGLRKSFVAYRRGYHSTRFLISFNMS